jgi:hypothetical protein
MRLPWTVSTPGSKYRIHNHMISTDGWLADPGPRGSNDLATPVLRAHGAGVPLVPATPLAFDPATHGPVGAIPYLDIPRLGWVELTAVRLPLYDGVAGNPVSTPFWLITAKSF